MKEELEDEYIPSKPYWQCQECGYENHDKLMPADKQKFHRRPDLGYKCPKCKSQSLIPIGY